MDAKRRKIQLELAFMAEGRGEAPMAADKGTEASKAKRKPEDPALPVLLYWQNREQLNQPNRRGTDPYAQWCDRESPRGHTYVDLF